MKIINEISTASNRINYKLFTTETDNIIQYGMIISTTLFGAEESDCVKDITTDKELAERMLYTFADNTVLPSTMREIIEEYINEEQYAHC